MMDKLMIMSFGLGGNSGDGVSADGNRFSSSWYLRDPDEFVRYIGRDAKGYGYDPASVDGCIVLDKRAILREHPSYALLSPMLDVRLPAGTIDRLADHGAKDSMVLHAFAHGDSTQRGLAALAHATIDNQSEQPGPMDYVSMDAYVDWWASRGARVGVVKLNPARIEWRVK